MKNPARLVKPLNLCQNKKIMCGIDLIIIQGLPQAGRGKEKTMAFYIALLAAALLWMGWYGWRVDCKVDRKVRRLQSKCKSKEPRRKEREDYWAA